MNNSKDLARQLEQDARELEASHRQQQEALAEAGEEAADVLTGAVTGGIAGAVAGAVATVGGEAAGLSGAALGGPVGAVAGVIAGGAYAELSRAEVAEAEADAAEGRANMVARAQQIQQEQGVSGPEALKQAQREADADS